MAGSPVLATVRAVIEWASLGIEILGALVIVAGVLSACARTQGRT